VAPSYAETDWPQIVVLYDELLKVWPSPVVSLNRAIAVAELSGPAAALADEAEVAYRAALELTDNEAERTFLQARLA
jgi:RNA polymerase sigma-70 factor (ECF subfamily)